MVTHLATWWNNVPQPLRDFGEGIAAAAISGAALGVLGINLASPDVTAKAVEAAAIFGAVSAVIAFARHRLAAPQSP